MALYLSAFVAQTAVAAADWSVACERAAVEAAAESGVPVSVMKAIALVETGRTRGGQERPWPWTVNMEGKGIWFDSREAALAYLYEHYKRGARSFDVGCFQVNYKWHHEHFASISEMLDPSANARYAAAFLQSLRTESRDWTEAAGAYHSQTPGKAEHYKEKFAAFRGQFEHEDGRPLVVMPPLRAVAVQEPRMDYPLAPRVNTYPLLQGGGQPALGSLVPLAQPTGTGGLFARDMEPEAG